VGGSARWQLSGYFDVVYGESQSAPINANASADDVSEVLEGLPGIETVSVERNFAVYALISLLGPPKVLLGTM